MLEGMWRDHSWSGSCLCSCTSIQIFCREAAKIIAKVMCLDIRVSFTTLYLGSMPDGLIENDIYPFTVLLAGYYKILAEEK